MREIELRGSNLDTFVAEEQGHLAVYYARLGSLVVIVFLLGTGRHLSLNGTDHGYRTYFDRQPPTLTARVDRVLVDLDQNDRPVAQKMRTSVLYFELLVFRQNRLKLVILI